MSRDWHEDMEYCNRLDDKGQSFISPEVLKYWLQQAAEEKKRADELDQAVKKPSKFVSRWRTQLTR